MGVLEGDTVGIFSENRPEWVIADLAIQMLGGVVVPIHSVFQPKYIKHVIRDAGIKVIVVSDSHLFEKLHAVDEDLGLEKIMYCSRNKIFGLDREKFVYFGDLVDTGKAGEFTDTGETSELLRDTPATIVYTSGTLGLPKGVVLTHKNIISNIEAVLKAIPVEVGDRLLSLLPLSHIFERTAGYYTPLSQGASIFYAEGYENLRKDLRGARPTILVGVPRVFEKAYEKIQKNKHIAPLIRFAMGRRLIGKIIKKRFGGKINFCISGGAALDKHIGAFFEQFGLPILEGYGLTETAPVVSVNRLNAYKFGSCGLPLSNVSVKLAQDGELLVKGDSIMKGYHNLPQDTARAFTEDGYFRTGDFARIDDEGFIYIIGRKKNIIVLSTGKNVQPEEIETALDASPYISQALVVGDGRKMVTALIVPEFDMFVPSEDEGLRVSQEEGNKGEKAVTDKMRAVIAEELARLLADFPDHEQIKKFTLLNKPFTVEADELTPTLKLKRKILEERYREVIDKMYR